MDNAFPNDVRVARIGKPHGIRGEVTVQVFTDSPETRFMVGNVFALQRVKAPGVSFSALTIEKARWNKKVLLLKFEEFSDRNTAEALRDSELFAPAEDLLDSEEGWYPDDLIGFSVHQEGLGSPKIGQITNLIISSAQDLLEIQLSDGREVLIPFVEEIVPEVDEKRGAIVIIPPQGLLELNQD